MMNNIVDYFVKLPFWELTAVCLSIAYVVLVAQNNRWCWPAALISTLIFTILFLDVSLLMESLLNLYYMAMAVYGWIHWHRVARDNTGRVLSDELPIARWTWQLHSKLIFLLSGLSLGLGYLMENYTSADYAYLDTFTTVFAVFTTYLVTIKLLENWLYWFVINSLSVFLYLQKGLEPTAALATFNILMCVIGWFKWQKIYQQQQPQISTDNAIKLS